MSSGSETTLIHLKIRPSSFDCTLCDALAMADWTQQYFFLATIFPEAPHFFIMFFQRLIFILGPDEN
jgi:hypothetical protein